MRRTAAPQTTLYTSAEDSMSDMWTPAENLGNLKHYQAEAEKNTCKHYISRILLEDLYNQPFPPHHLEEACPLSFSFGCA